MASTYSTNLGIELMGTGDQSGTWGATTNTNLGTLLEQAIAGYGSQAVADSASPTVLTISNGASSTGRNAVIVLTGALTLARVVEVPAKTKSYIFYNTTTGGFAVTVKVTGQTGVSIPNGTKAIVYCDGTDVRNVLSNITVDSSGNVGIGTTSNSGYRLAIVGSTASSVPLYLSTDATNSFIYSPNSMYVGSTGAYALTIVTNNAVRATIDSSGNVGIGTSSISTKLHVNGIGETAAPSTSGAKTATIYATANQNSTNCGGAIEFGGQTSTTFAAWKGGLNDGTSNTVGYLAAYTRNATSDTSMTERLRIDSSGNVGIGTSSPTQKFDVYAASGVLGLTVRVAGSTGSDQAFVIAQAGSNTAYMRQDGNGGSFLVAPNYWSIFTNSSERMRIDSSGNVGIGTSSPKTRLQSTAATTLNAPSLGSATSAPFYVTNSDPSYGLLVGTNASDGHVWLQAQRTDGSATAYNITLNEAGGNLLVGTTTLPISTSRVGISGASVVGVGVVSLVNTSQSTKKWSTGPDENGNFLVLTDASLGMYMLYGNIAWTANSDERLKTDLIPIENAASKVSSLRAVTGRFKTDEEGTSRAFLIAQDVQAVLPEAVDANNPDKLGVQYTDVIPLLVAAIKELSAKVTALESR